MHFIGLLGGINHFKAVSGQCKCAKCVLQYSILVKWGEGRFQASRDAVSLKNRTAREPTLAVLETMGGIEKNTLRKV